MHFFIFVGINNLKQLKVITAKNWLFTSNVSLRLFAFSLRVPFAAGNEEVEVETCVRLFCVRRCGGAGALNWKAEQVLPLFVLAAASAELRLRLAAHFAVLNFLQIVEAADLLLLWHLLGAKTEAVVVRLKRVCSCFEQLQTVCCELFASQVVAIRRLSSCTCVCLRARKRGRS